MNRGPPYERAAENYTPTAKSVWFSPRRIDHRIQEVEQDEKKIVLAKEEKAVYALGLLGVEAELSKLDLEQGERVDR